MSEQHSDHDLLIEINQKLNNLISQWEKVSNGVGFPRCAARGEQLETIEKRQEAQASAIRWTWKSILLIPVTYVIVEIVKRWNSI